MFAWRISCLYAVIITTIIKKEIYCTKKGKHFKSNDLRIHLIHTIMTKVVKNSDNNHSTTFVEQIRYNTDVTLKKNLPLSMTMRNTNFYQILV